MCNNDKYYEEPDEEETEECYEVRTDLEAQELDSYNDDGLYNEE